MPVKIEIEKRHKFSTDEVTLYAEDFEDDTVMLFIRVEDQIIRLEVTQEGVRDLHEVLERYMMASIAHKLKKIEGSKDTDAFLSELQNKTD